MAFLALLAKPAIAGLLKFVIGAGLAYFAAKPIIEKWGSTPNNRAAEAGISNRDVYEYSRKSKKEKLDYLKEKSEEKNKELKEENEKLKEEIKKLEKRLLKETEEWKNETDPTEKAKKLAIMEATQKELNDAKSQLNKNESIIKKNEADIVKLYDELSKGAEHLTEEQIKSKNNYPDLNSWLNWGIIAVVVIVAILIVKFIFSLFKKLGQGIE
jgi:hypothetical protein